MLCLSTWFLILKLFPIRCIGLTGFALHASLTHTHTHTHTHSRFQSSSYMHVEKDSNYPIVKLSRHYNICGGLNNTFYWVIVVAKLHCVTWGLLGGANSVGVLFGWCNRHQYIVMMSIMCRQPSCNDEEGKYVCVLELQYPLASCAFVLSGCFTTQPCPALLAVSK